MGTWKTIAGTLTIAIAIVIAVVLGIIFSGVIDVAATKPHYALTKWVLQTTMEHSVDRRAKLVILPRELNWTLHDEQEYMKMCEPCHGGPGTKPSEVGKGLRPKPPDLTKVVRDMESSEIFWIIKNGIRMTGMPAFGPTHPDEKLWPLVAFVKDLPQMPPEKYRKIRKSQGMNPEKTDGEILD